MTGLPATLTVVCAAVAGWLLAGGGRSPAEYRLAALLESPAPAPASGRGPWRAGPCAAVLVAAAPVATACLVLGPVLGLLAGSAVGIAIWWRLRRGDTAVVRRRRSRITAALPVAVDLLTATLRAGATMTDALDAVAAAVGGPLAAELAAVADRLRLGADAAEAWRDVRDPPALASLARALARAARTGAPVAGLLDRHSAECRRAARANAVARSQRTGVLVVLPLGLCFLPAFVLIGVVPLAAGLVDGSAMP
ncbi:type II secretion system F family protein [Marinactinospora rubrisoli]|uniref:Type II secretion system F family protein n=1 Tax=Marinactinospora rubrisoli TaxID=2715399 RepID=A0ABW2K9W8_9ACTN